MALKKEVELLEEEEEEIKGLTTNNLRLKKRECVIS